MPFAPVHVIRPPRLRHLGGEGTGKCRQRRDEALVDDVDESSAREYRRERAQR